MQRLHNHKHSLEKLSLIIKLSITPLLLYPSRLKSQNLLVNDTMFLCLLGMESGPLPELQLHEL